MVRVIPPPSSLSSLQGLYLWLSQRSVQPVVHGWQQGGQEQMRPARCWLWHTWHRFAIAGLDTDKATSQNHTLCCANSSPTQGREHPERKLGDKHCEEQKKTHKANHHINQTKAEISEDLNKQISQAPFDFFAPGSCLHWRQSHSVFTVLPRQTTQRAAL